MADAFSETIVDETPGTMTLKVIQGKDEGKKYALAEGHGMIIGRMQDSDIQIDPADKLVSRHHARVTRQSDTALLEDLGSGNGTFVGDEKISQQLLQPGAVFRIGGTTFVLELHCTQEPTNVTMYLDSEKPVKKGGSKIRIILLGLLLVCMLFFIFIMVSGNKDTKQAEKMSDSEVKPAEQAAPVKDVVPAKQISESAPAVAVSAPVKTATDPPASEPVGDSTAKTSGSSDTQKKESQDHFRRGRFFYNTGNLEKAVDEWNLACDLDPESKTAKKWLLRAEQELDEQIDTHYRRGLKAKKYMRYTDARNEFKLVVKWSRDKEDERYLDALKQLEELKDK